MPKPDEEVKIKSAEDLVDFIEEGNKKQLTEEILPLIEKKFDELNAKVESKLTPIAENIKEAEPKFDSLGEQLQSIAKYFTEGPGYVDKRLKFENKHGEPSGLHEGTPSEGGFLVQTDFVSALLKPVHEASIILQKCWRLPIGPGSNSVSLKSVKETSRASGSRWGGIQVYWVDEADTVTAKKPSFSRIDMKLGKLMGICYATEENLEDAIQLEGVIKQGFKEEFSFKIDDSIMRGTGTTQPKGIISSNGCVEVAKHASNAANTVIAENILEMYNRMAPRSQIRAEWYINPDVELQLQQMYLSAGATGYLMYVPPGGLSQAPYGTLMGKKVNSIEQASAIGSVGDIVYADFSQYLVIEKGGLAATDSIHVRFLYDEHTFKFKLRLNGQPLNDHKVTAAQGSTTRAAFVRLAAR